MRSLAPGLWLCLAVAGCQCFEPVDDCTLAGCDAGADAGPEDAGSDAGTFPGICGVWDGGGEGYCFADTAIVFTGASCEARCILPLIPRPGVFPDFASCIRCRCRRDRFVSWSPLADGGVFGPGSHCDAVVVVTTQPALLATELHQPELLDGGCPPPGPTGVTACQIRYSGTLGDDGFLRACVASYTAGVTEVQCRIYLP